MWFIQILRLVTLVFSSFPHVSWVDFGRLLNRGEFISVFHPAEFGQKAVAGHQKCLRQYIGQGGLSRDGKMQAVDSQLEVLLLKRGNLFEHGVGIAFADHYPGTFDLFAGLIDITKISDKKGLASGDDKQPGRACVATEITHVVQMIDKETIFSAC